MKVHACVRTGLVYECLCGWSVGPGIPDTEKVDKYVAHVVEDSLT